MAVAGAVHEATRPWDLPDLRARGVPVRFSRGRLDVEAALGESSPARTPAPLVVVDDGVAARHPTLAMRLAGGAMRTVVVPGGERVRPDAADDGTRALALHRGPLVAVGGAAMFAWIERSFPGVHAPQIRVPTSLPGLVEVVGTTGPVTGAVLVDLELLRTLTDHDWRIGVACALEVAVARDADLFDWIDRQARELRARSLPAMAWVVHRTAASHIDGPRRAAVGVVGDHPPTQESRAATLALRLTCARLAGLLPAPEWERAMRLFERLGIAAWPPATDGRLRGAPATSVMLALPTRIGAAAPPRRIDRDLVTAAAAALRRGMSRPRSWGREAAATSPPRF